MGQLIELTTNTKKKNDDRNFSREVVNCEKTGKADGNEKHTMRETFNPDCHNESEDNHF